MRMFSWVTVLIAAVTPAAVVALVALRADPAGPTVQLINSAMHTEWLLAGLLLVALAPWPALTVAAIDRDRRRRSSAGHSWPGGGGGGSET